MNLSYKERKKETEKAVLFEITKGVEKWIPKSVIEVNLGTLPEKNGSVSIADWFAKKNGLGDYEDE